MCLDKQFEEKLKIKIDFLEKNCLCSYDTKLSHLGEGITEKECNFYRIVLINIRKPWVK